MQRIFIDSNFGPNGPTVEVKRFTGLGPDGWTLQGERIGRVYHTAQAAQRAVDKLLASGKAEWYGKGEK